MAAAAAVKNCTVINSREEIDDSAVPCGCAYVKFAVNERRRGASPVYPFSKLLYATKSHFSFILPPPIPHRTSSSSRDSPSTRCCCSSSPSRRSVILSFVLSRLFIYFFFFLNIRILYCNDIIDIMLACYLQSWIRFKVDGKKIPSLSERLA